MSDRPIKGFVDIHNMEMSFLSVLIIFTGVMLFILGTQMIYNDLMNEVQSPSHKSLSIKSEEIRSVIIHVENESFSYPAVKNFEVCGEGEEGEYYWFSPLSFGPELPGCMCVTIDTNIIEKIAYDKHGMLEIWNLPGTKYTLEKSHEFYRT